jgi:hypothetical protein|tara:strand:+ start:67 stop:843 length:777 start_codon:yes stop_codon:yes gene_type:complete
MNEFICPNGRMSVNGVCPIFEGSDGQVKDFMKKSTYDAMLEDETLSDRLATDAPLSNFNKTKPEINTSSITPKIDNKLNYIETINQNIFPKQNKKLKEIEKDRKKDNFFQFDFEEPTENAFEKAENIISKNIGAYNSFVEENLGIPSNIQNVARFGSAITGFGTYGTIGAVVPFAIPFVAGAALNNQAVKEQEAAINRESVRDLQNRIDKGEFGSVTPTPQDEYRGGGQYTGGNTKSSSRGSKSGGFDSKERGAALHG